MISDITPDVLAQSLTTESTGRATEIYSVALTTESLALGWLRQRQAPHGALVLAGQEISPRTRSGDFISIKNGLSFSVVLRPTIAVDYQDILWATALAAACASYTALEFDVSAWWPETIFMDGSPIAYARAETQLAPGVVESSVLTFRLGFPEGIDEGQNLTALNACLLAIEELLEDTPTTIAYKYGQKCALKGRPIRVNLRPNGASGGVAESIDERGGFGVAASSGSVTRFAVDQIREILVRP